MTSCGSDEPCTTDTFAGSYSGELNCSGIKGETSLMLSKVSATQILLTDEDGEEFTLDVVDCTATFSEDLGGLGSVALELVLDGDKLNYKNDSEVFGFSVSCSGTLKRD